MTINSMTSRRASGHALPVMPPPDGSDPRPTISLPVPIEAASDAPNTRRASDVTESSHSSPAGSNSRSTNLETTPSRASLSGSVSPAADQGSTPKSATPQGTKTAGRRGRRANQVTAAAGTNSGPAAIAGSGSMPTTQESK